MADPFKLTYCDSIPSVQPKKAANKYAVTLRQFIRSGRAVAQIHAQSEKAASNMVAGFRKEIKQGGYDAACIKRGQDIYLTRKEEQP